MRRGDEQDGPYELEQWIPKVEERTLTLEGTLSASSLKRITSLFDRPPAFKAQVTASDPLTPPAVQPNTEYALPVTLQATKEHFRRVLDLVDDLHHRPNQGSNYSLGSIALWCETFARKIDQLPQAGVDPELVRYGNFVSDSLRSAAASIRNSYVRRRVRQSSTPVPYDYYTYNTTYGYSYRWNLFGGGLVPWGEWGTYAVPDYRAYQQNLNAITAQERAAAGQQMREIFAKIDAAAADVRGRMTEKFKEPF